MRSGRPWPETLAQASLERVDVVRVVLAVRQERCTRLKVADGPVIPNEGDKSFIAMHEHGTTCGLKMQVCEVNKSVLSVGRITQAGNRVILER